MTKSNITEIFSREEKAIRATTDLLSAMQSAHNTWGMEAVRMALTHYMSQSIVKAKGVSKEEALNQTLRMLTSLLKKRGMGNVKKIEVTYDG